MASSWADGRWCQRATSPSGGAGEASPEGNMQILTSVHVNDHHGRNSRRNALCGDGLLALLTGCSYTKASPPNLWKFDYKYVFDS